MSATSLGFQHQSWIWVSPQFASLDTDVILTLFQPDLSIAIVWSFGIF